MYKKLVIWFFFTIIAGILPIGFKWVVCNLVEIPFSYANICSEIFFFDLILSADGLKELYDIENNKKHKILLYSSLIFFIIILSAIYSVLLLSDYKQIDLDLEKLYVCSETFTACCFIINFIIQIFGGINIHEY